METLDTLQRNYAQHAQAAADAGHPDIRTTPIMRTVFLAGSRRQSEEIRARVHSQAQESGRLAEGASVDDWTIIGDAALVADRGRRIS